MAEYENFKNQLDTLMSDDNDGLLAFSMTVRTEGFGKAKIGVTKHRPFLDGMLKEYRLAISALNRNLNISLWFDGYSLFYNKDGGHDSILFIFMYRGKVAGTLSIHKYDNLVINAESIDVKETVKE